ncbi:DUF4221 family protein [Pleomorphovibrio marinus]|uniref:DUF4221 family protein n=1 Tax=Pleomorphovibrio marinus TaxID=2164132 RepID=UPI000E0BD4B2|nr:DUF4221 family protein [Pleomorphovibrio marinus]
MDTAINLSKIVFLSLCFAFIGCAEKKDIVDLSLTSLNYSLDTVMIDPGNELLHLNAGLRMATLDAERDYLYNFNPSDHTIEKINLNSRKLEDKLAFEKEGPDGVGDMVFRMDLISDELVAFMGYIKAGIFDLKGRKVVEFPIAEVNFDGDPLIKGERFEFLNTYMFDSVKMVGLIRNATEKSFALGVLDSDFRHLKKVPIPLDVLENFRFVLSSTSRVQMSFPSATISEHNGRYLITNEVNNTILLYHLEIDFLKEINYQPMLTEDRKKGKYTQVTETEEEFNQETQNVRKEISFMAPIWDENNHRFYRFSHKAVNIGNNSSKEEEYKSSVFLTVFDADFNVIAESLVEDLTKPPGFHFVKDRKIWMYENMEDEMGFVRLLILDL